MQKDYISQGYVAVTSVWLILYFETLYSESKNFLWSNFGPIFGCFQMMLTDVEKIIYWCWCWWQCCWQSLTLADHQLFVTNINRQFQRRILKCWNIFFRMGRLSRVLITEIINSYLSCLDDTIDIATYNSIPCYYINLTIKYLVYNVIIYHPVVTASNFGEFWLSRWGASFHIRPGVARSVVF